MRAMYVRPGTGACPLCRCPWIAPAVRIGGYICCACGQDYFVAQFDIHLLEPEWEGLP